MLRLLPLLAVAIAAWANITDRHLPSPSKAVDDATFVRRVYLDLIGRLPTVDAAKAFAADTDPAKRQKLIKSLFPPLPITGMRSIKEDPFLDRWAYFFNDLFRNGQLLEEGINTFYDFIYKSLLLNVPYDEFVRDMITASTVSTWTDGPSNLIARSHVFEGDGYQINHEDTADEIAINTTRIFLGVNLECVSCHDGKGHLEKVNVFLSQRKRADLWRQASFFGKTYIAPVFGRTPQFMVKDKAKGYDLTTTSSLRPPRKSKEAIRAAFLFGGEAQPNETERQAYARLLTGHPQFARTIVNLVWAELMGTGIVDPPLDFDLARQDPKNPPPAPWILQPSHPELLDALAEDFRANGHDLRRLIEGIVSSRAYAANAHRTTRRLSAEQLWDAVGQVSGIQPEMKVTFSDKKFTYAMQARSPQDVEKSAKPVQRLLAQFGQCDRYAAEADRRPGMVQSALWMNEKVLLERTKASKGSRLERLIAAKNPEALIEELYWAALSRPPSASEKAAALEADPEDLLWAIFNRLDFLFY
jgi:hypothetical protein